MNLQEAVSIYLKIILQFLAELYVFHFLVTLKLNRSKFFAIKAVAGLVAVAAVAFGVAIFYYFYGQTVWGRIFVYVFLFALTVAHVKLCFAENFKIVLFCCSLAYAAQNFVYKLFLVFWTAGERYGLFDGWGNSFDLFYRLTYYSFFAVASVAAYFLFIRRQNSRLSNRQLNFGLMGLAVFVLGITVILCSFEDVYFAALSVVRENKFDVPEYVVLRQTGNVFSVVCCAIVLILISKTVDERDLKSEVEYLQYAVRQGEKQYEISKDTIDLINVKCHDIKYKINALIANNGGNTAEMLNDINESISIYDTKVETGNKILNVLLTEKSLYCEQNGIRFSCMADGEKLSFMGDGDLYCLFGNLIDNALEAVNGIEEKERRVINLVVKCKNDILTIQEENYFDGELRFEDGLPVTTKSDKNYHGFGVRSLKMIVKKYGGELTAHVSNGVFHLNIILPLGRK